MELISLYIENYKKYQKQNIIFASNSKFYCQQDIFGGMNITLFCGENGTGKTTILSFIAKIFRYIERFRERIPCDFILEYIIDIRGKDHHISLKKVGKNISITIEKTSYHIMEYNIRKKENVHDPKISISQVAYKDIKQYLPCKVIVIGFDIDYVGMDYSCNYHGDRLVEYRNINDAYASTGIGSDFSIGILNTIIQAINDLEIASILKSIKLEITSFVDVYFNFQNEYVNKNLKKQKIEDKYFTENFWEQYVIKKVGKNSRIDLSSMINDKKAIRILKRLVKDRYIYINEFYIKKNSVNISISGMSTGEKEFLYRLFFLASRICNNLLIIWEEPETHFNKLWSNQLIPLLTLMFKKYSIHLLLSSHETTLINSLFSNQIILLENNQISHPDFQTFLANENEIIYKLYKMKGYDYFENYIVREINSCDKEKLEELLENIGESFLKFLIFQRLNE